MKDALEAAISDIQEILKFLVAQMRERGYPDAVVRYALKADEAPVLTLQTDKTANGPATLRNEHGMRVDWLFIREPTFARALARAQGAISAMEVHPSIANAPYFDPLHPMNQPDGAPPPPPAAGDAAPLPGRVAGASFPMETNNA